MIRCRQVSQCSDQLLDLALIELALEFAGPASALSLVASKQFGAQLPHMLAGVIEVDDLNRVGEILLGEIPDPSRSVANNDLFLGAAPAPPCFLK